LSGQAVVSCYDALPGRAKPQGAWLAAGRRIKTSNCRGCLVFKAVNRFTSGLGKNDLSEVVKCLVIELDDMRFIVWDEKTSENTPHGHWQGFRSS